MSTDCEIKQWYREGSWWYSLEDIARAASGFPLQLHLEELLVFDNFVEHSSLMKWLKTLKLRFSYDLLNALKKNNVQRRKWSSANRWSVAYEQQYKCHNCLLLLEPGAWELDHVIELCDGGVDDRSNCVALCRNCHGKKTQLERMKRTGSKYFSKNLKT